MRQLLVLTAVLTLPCVGCDEVTLSLPLTEPKAAAVDGDLLGAWTSNPMGGGQYLVIRPFLIPGGPPGLMEVKEYRAVHEGGARRELDSHSHHYFLSVSKVAGKTYLNVFSRNGIRLEGGRWRLDGRLAKCHLVRYQIDSDRLTYWVAWAPNEVSDRLFGISPPKNIDPTTLTRLLTAGTAESMFASQVKRYVRADTPAVPVRGGPRSSGVTLLLSMAAALAGLLALGALLVCRALVRERAPGQPPKYGGIRTGFVWAGWTLLASCVLLFGPIWAVLGQSYAAGGDGSHLNALSVLAWLPILAFAFGTVWGHAVPKAARPSHAAAFGFAVLLGLVGSVGSSPGLRTTLLCALNGEPCHGGVPARHWFERLRKSTDVCTTSIDALIRLGRREEVTVELRHRLNRSGANDVWKLVDVLDDLDRGAANQVGFDDR